MSDISKDTDGDGLSNFAEAQIGTDVANADSDGDMVGDGTEWLLGLNPNDIDSDGDQRLDNQEDYDGDGIPDVAEVHIGTDWKKVDSDGDGLTDDLEDADGDGETNYTEVSNWSDPRSAASKSDSFTQNTFVDFGRDLDGDGIIESAEDLDGDGLSAKSELVTGVGEKPTDPSKADTDGDGVDDLYEARYDLDPHDADTNDDGVDDATEVRAAEADFDARFRTGERWDAKAEDDILATSDELGDPLEGSLDDTGTEPGPGIEVGGRAGLEQSPVRVTTDVLTGDIAPAPAPVPTVLDVAARATSSPMRTEAPEVAELPDDAPETLRPIDPTVFEDQAVELSAVDGPLYVDDVDVDELEIDADLILDD